MATEKQFEAETEREAIELACSDFGVTKEELSFSIVDKGSAGLFGMGARPVIISASVAAKETKAKKETLSGEKEKKPKKATSRKKPAPKKAEAAESDDATETSEASAPAAEERVRVPGITGPAPEKAAQTKEVTEELCNQLGMPVVVEVRDEEEQIVVVLNEAEDSTAVADLLGSTRPPALPSLQFLLNKIVNRFPDNRKHIVVEAESVAERIATRKAEAAERRKQAAKSPQKSLPDNIDEEMVAIAKQLVEKANSLGKVITILPMTAADRRAIHQTVMTIEDADTMSEGEGLFRRIHVVPDALRTKKNNRRRRRGGRGRDSHQEEAVAAEETPATEEASATVEEVAAAASVESEHSTETEAQPNS
ncbi:MAG: Jag N-terminal domain-containing protein [Myxococcota bacterium]|nr:Jag N-terminal domain-containing protein [Myxococcota bacterium]